MTRRQQKPEKDPIPPPHLYTEGRPVTTLFFETMDPALQAAHAAEILGLSWRLDSYHAPPDSDVQYREFRLVAWSEVVADTLPIISRE